jgi:hypothetical protein
VFPSKNLGCAPSFDTAAQSEDINCKLPLSLPDERIAPITQSQLLSFNSTVSESQALFGDFKSDGAQCAPQFLQGVEGHIDELVSKLLLPINDEFEGMQFHSVDIGLFDW